MVILSGFAHTWGVKYTDMSWGNATLNTRGNRITRCHDEEMYEKAQTNRGITFISKRLQGNDAILA